MENVATILLKCQRKLYFGGGKRNVYLGLTRFICGSWNSY